MLFVEDDARVLDSISRLLEAEGLRVDRACDGETGLAMARAVPYEVILLDQRLPRMPDLEVLRQLDLAGVRTPVVILTAFPNTDSAFEARGLGAVGYLSKPVRSSAELAAKLRAAAATAQPRMLKVNPALCSPFGTGRGGTRKHQVKVSLRQADSMEITSFGRQEGAGSGTFVRRLALTHLTALRKSGVATGPTRARERDKVRFGHHISVWFTDEEHALLQHFSTTAGLTVSGYLGRCVLEPWLRMRRNARAVASATAQSPRRP